MKLLTYGILTHNDVMPSSAIRLGPVPLYGYGWEMLMFANIYESVGDFFVGILWEIDANILEKLDHREGYPDFYTRILVNVDYEDNAIEPVWVYIMTPEAREYYAGTSPDNNYIEMVTNGYSQDNLFLPNHYGE